MEFFMIKAPPLFSDFTHLYPLAKTLRFELKPQGKTKENIEKINFISDDEQRARDYQEAKIIIDEYHKSFMKKNLKKVKLPIKDLCTFQELYMNAKKDEKKFEDIQKKLRGEIDKIFKSDKLYESLFSKELIKNVLVKFLAKNVEKKHVIEKFESWTTYFTGFHENRKNMYTQEAKSTAIGFRLIHENLPKFLNNIKAFERVKDTLADQIQTLEKELKINNIEPYFTLKFYEKCLTQSGIDFYNLILGGKSEDNVKIKGLNEYINLHNQPLSKKEDKLPKFTMLFKQILTDRVAISWLPKQIEDDQMLLKAIHDFYTENEELFSEKIKNLFLDIKTYDLEKIFIKNDFALTELSKQLYGDWELIKIKINELAQKELPIKKNESDEKYQERKKKYIEKQYAYVSIAQLNQWFKNATLKESQDVEKPVQKVEDFFASSLPYTNILQAYENIKNLVSTPYPENQKLVQNEDHVELIKKFLDCVKNLQRFMKTLEADVGDKEVRFYADFDNNMAELKNFNKLYDAIRNYLTKKPYSLEKFKLNFGQSTLANGWDVNKEHERLSVILHKQGHYFLAIMNKKHNQIFKKVQVAKADEIYYEKMEYKLLPGPSKMLPKVFLSETGIKTFKPSKKILENYENKTHIKGDTFNLEDCHALIDFFKESIEKHVDWKHFNFQFKNTESYEDISDFYREVESQGYKIAFKKIPANYIDACVENGEMYLFEIYNKDFSEKSTGTPNMHTLYWRALFEEENLKNVVYKLNGEAELFYRRGSIKKQITHPAHQVIQNKNQDNPKKSSTFEYDLIKDKRFTEDKFQFHVSITLNFKSQGHKVINNKAIETLQKANDVHVIGIDRGERHLLYISLINGKGDIVKQFSCNTVENEKQKVDYHHLLDMKEKQRQEARVNWGAIEKIKELKEGYLSQVIHQITQLMIEYNAIVVLEDLNAGFKRGRFKFEKQVYQKFEKMLIEKLNYYVDKKQKEGVGSLYNALQLTNKFESFQKLGKQSGFLFYVRAWNTSKIDPVTGFVNFFTDDKHLKYESEEKAKTQLNYFDTIRYNTQKEYFEFQAKDKNEKSWTICTYGNRILTRRSKDKNNQFTSEVIKLTTQFKKLFETNQIEYQSGDNIKEQLLQQTNKKFFETLLWLIRLTVQLRNTDKDNDYLISPIADKKGCFFDSSHAPVHLPQDADANGAYHIARKGLMVLNKIKAAFQSSVEDKIDLFISDTDFLEEMQNKNSKK